MKLRRRSAEQLITQAVITEQRGDRQRDVVGAGGDPWNGVRFAVFGGSPQATHAVDITDTLDRGIASLEAHRTYLDALSEGTTGTEPDAFLRGMAAEAGPRLGVDLATTFELIPLG